MIEFDIVNIALIIGVAIGMLCGLAKLNMRLLCINWGALMIYNILEIIHTPHGEIGIFGAITFAIISISLVFGLNFFINQIVQSKQKEQ